MADKRHEARYQRRKAKRIAKKEARSVACGTFEDIFSFNNLFTYGKKACNGVRWKQSIQNFERHRLSRCAVLHRSLQAFSNDSAGAYKMSGYKHFKISERGKVREIDAPKIDDKVVQKVLTAKVLQPLYDPILINNNGASRTGRGIRFSRRELKKDIHKHFTKYGKTGQIILIDFHHFFPNASHAVIKKRHRDLIFDTKIRKLSNIIVDSVPQGMPLGIEPSQYEMIAFPNKLDQYIKCQLGIECFGRYMDDYYLILPEIINAQEILTKIYKVADDIEVEINRQKTHIINFGKPFTYCKVRYRITNSGKIITHGNRKGIKASKSKIIKFKKDNSNSEVIWGSMQSVFSYLVEFNNHSDYLKLQRLFYKTFGFYCRTYKNVLDEMRDVA